MATNTSRLMELDRQRPAARRAAAPRRRPANTLEPLDDVIDERRYKHLHRTQTGASAATGRQLRENAVMLLLLAASIYGLYELVLYVLNH